MFLKSGTAQIYFKLGQVLLQNGLAVLYYKVGQVVLRGKAGITKWGNFYYKMGASITKRGKFY